MKTSEMTPFKKYSTFVNEYEFVNESGDHYQVLQEGCGQTGLYEKVTNEMGSSFIRRATFFLRARASAKKVYDTYLNTMMCCDDCECDY